MAARKKEFPPTHPGEVLHEDFMIPTATSINKLALDLHVAPTRIYEIVKGERAVTADTALRLSRYLGTSPAFWLNLQQQYDLECARTELGARIEEEVRPRAGARQTATPVRRRKSAVSGRRPRIVSGREK
jgi:addiction module HigA family antidote